MMQGPVFAPTHLRTNYAYAPNEDGTETLVIGIQFGELTPFIFRIEDARLLVENVQREIIRALADPESKKASR